jgi:hypothetical protein
MSYRSCWYIDGTAVNTGATGPTGEIGPTGTLQNLFQLLEEGNDAGLRNISNLYNLEVVKN